ncbi:MAG: hypothetical protein HYY30_15045 [Chloroflexi bacterium]|nr:hypothetical protein [Chloroflexota bacterium]
MRSEVTHKVRRGSFVGPLILITIGVLFLLGNLGYLSWGFWQSLLRFWPVILILFGVEVLFGRSWPWVGAITAVVVLAGVTVFAALTAGEISRPIAAGSAKVERIVEETGNLTSANVQLEFGAGDITIDSLPKESSNLVEADIVPGTGGRQVEKNFNASNGQGVLTLRSQARSWAFVGPNVGDSWDVKLTRNIPLSLRVKTGASRSLLDLTDLNVADLWVDVGASTLDLRMPQAGSTKATVKAGAASVRIEILPTMAARVRARAGLSSTNVDEERFPRRGEYFVSSDWDSAIDRIDLDVDSGVASVSVR